MATYYMDFINGKDRAVNAAAFVYNPSGTTIRVCYLRTTKHGLSTGDQVVLSLFTAYLNGTFTISVVDEYQFDLVGIAWQATADPTGTVTPVIGTPNGLSWANATRTVSPVQLQVGDILKIAKTPDPVSSGVNATFIKFSDSVQLSTPLTLDIDTCVGNTWTAANVNVTPQLNSSTRYGASSQRFYINTAFTTGKVAHKVLASTLDLSNFSAISFYVNLSVYAGFNYYSKFRLCLCSDTSGDVIVNSLQIPPIEGANTFIPYVVQNGSSLGSSIRSIALYADEDPGVVYISLCNIFACNDLHLNSIIGEATNNFYSSIMSIVGSTIILEGGYTNYSTKAGVYPHATITTEMLIRSGAQLISTSNYNPNIYINADYEPQYSNGIINIIGGVDKNTDIADGATIVDGLFLIGLGLMIGSNMYSVYSETNNIWVCRCNVGMQIGAPAEKFSNAKIFSNAKGLSFLSSFNPIGWGAFTYLENIDMYCNYSGNINLQNSNNIFINCNSYRAHAGSSDYSITITADAHFNVFKNCLLQKNTIGTTFALTLSGGDNKFISCDFEYAAPVFDSKGLSRVFFIGCNNPFTSLANTHALGYGDYELHHIPDYVTGFNSLAKRGISLIYQTTYKPDGLTGAWSAIFSAQCFKNHLKVNHKIAELYVEGGKQCTVSLQVLVNNQNTTYMELFVRESYQLGLSSDVILKFSPSTEWTTIQLSFTPVNTGIAEICFGLEYKESSGEIPIYFTNLIPAQ